MNKRKAHSMENIVILGGGVAGWTAAVYTARAGLQPIVVSGNEPGGQLYLTTQVENFPGFPDGIQGPELVDNIRKQAKKFGAIEKQDTCQSFNKKEQGYEIALKKENIQAKSVIIATGASARWLGLPGEKELIGKGLSSCATCDGYFFQDKEIAVVGGGDSAMEEAIFLTRFAKKVTIVHRRDKLRASNIMQKKVMNNEKITLLWNTEITKYKEKEGMLAGMYIKENKTQKEEELAVEGVFMAIGHIPNTTPFTELLALDENKYLITDRQLHTQLPGVFGAGDVVDTRYRQAVTAAGMGCQAALEAERYLEDLEN